MAIHLSIEGRYYEFYGIGLFGLFDIERIIFRAVDQREAFADVLQSDSGVVLLRLRAVEAVADGADDLAVRMTAAVTD
jgi:hypothetical protein